VKEGKTRGTTLAADGSAGGQGKHEKEKGSDSTGGSVSGNGKRKQRGGKQYGYNKPGPLKESMTPTAWGGRKSGNGEMGKEKKKETQRSIPRIFVREPRDPSANIGHIEGQRNTEGGEGGTTPEEDLPGKK